MTPKLKDLGYVGGALVLAFGLLGVMMRSDLTGFGLWPQFVQWAVWSLFCAWLGVALGYSLAWSRREDRSA